MLLSIKRAGAKVILTYFAKDFAKQKKITWLSAIMPVAQ
jgi:delta-aminolevulinic acid dehydratase/porphobilinogen synthase